MKRSCSILVALAAAVVCAVGQEAPEVETKYDDKSKKVLDALGAFYKSQNSFTCSYRLDFSVEAEGQRQTATLVCNVAAERPNKLSLRHNDTQMAIDVVSDGKDMAVFVPQLNRYTVEKAPAGIEDAIEYASMGGVSSFIGILGDLFGADPAKALVTGVSDVSYVGEEDLNGAKHDRVRLSREDMALDLWVATGGKPYLGKVVPDLSKAMQKEGATVNVLIALSDWSSGLPVPAEKFVFTPPSGVEKVDGLAAMFGQEKSAAEGLVGQPAIAFSLKGIDGKPIDLSTYLGKNVVVLDFWATWCGPCVKSLPILTEVTNSFKDKGVVFIGVNQGEDADTINAFLKDQKLSFNVALDSEHAVGQQYKVEGIPQSVVIGKDGIIQSVHVGASPGLRQQLTDELTALVEGKSLVKPPADNEASAN